MAKVQKVNPDHQVAQDKMANDGTQHQIDHGAEHIDNAQQSADDKHYSSIHQGKHVNVSQSEDQIAGGKSSMDGDEEVDTVSTGTTQAGPTISIDASTSNESAAPVAGANTINAGRDAASDAIDNATENTSDSGADRVNSQVTPQQQTRVTEGDTASAASAPDVDTQNNPPEEAPSEADNNEREIESDDDITEVTDDDQAPFSFLTAPTVFAVSISGTETTASALDISVTSNSVNVPDEVLTVTIGNVPEGDTFSAGTNNGDGTWSFTTDELIGLTFTPPVGVETYNLSVTATAEGNDTTASTVETFDVNVAAGGENVTLNDSNNNYTSTHLSDTIYAQGGNDRIYGGEGDDTLHGEDGNDRLYGQGGNDTLNGGEGNDRLYGGEGNDTLTGGAGADKLYGQDGDDTFNVTGSEDVNTTYSGGSGYDTIQNVGNEDLQFRTFNKNWSVEEINANGHNIYGTSANNSLDFRNTKLTDVAEIHGGAGNDTIRGSEDNNSIYGDQGNDRLYGYGGDDTLQGGEGNDRLYGGAGDDTLTGGAGADKLYGEDGDDTFNVTGSEDVNTTYSGGSGYDSIQNIGNEDLQFKTFNKNWSVEEINADGHSIWGTSTNNSLDFRNTQLTDVDEIHGGGGRDTIRGSSDDNIIFGDDGNDRLYGYGGNDTLHGGTGSDRIWGGEGNDTLSGGAGNDRLYGESGDDIFLFGTGEGTDRAYGGSGWNDTIKLSNVSQDPNGSGSGSWTLNVNGSAAYELDSENQTITFTDGDASGSITLEDGSKLNFQDIEKIEW